MHFQKVKYPTRPRSANSHFHVPNEHITLSADESDALTFLAL